MKPFLKPAVKPNLFILGAAKSGTTTLHAVLSKHPDIYLSTEKEPTFFCEQFQVVKNPIDYFRLFDAGANVKWVGEASHAYLSNPESARVLHALFPDARFIVILRNPADRAYALYSHMRRYRLEKIRTFEAALRAEPGRMASPNFRKQKTASYQNFLYFHSGKYGEQVERYFHFFSPEQFLFLRFDDLKHNPGRVFQSIASFLGITAIDFGKLPVENKGYAIRSWGLEKIVRLPAIAQGPHRKWGLYKGLLFVNHKPMRPIRLDTRQALMERYQLDLGLLHRLTGISLDGPPDKGT
jgi:hypothetical protein